MQLSSAEWLAVEREYCRRSLVNFVRRAWPVLEPGQPYVHGWHMDAMGEHLEAVHYGWIKRLLINIPPGTMKSLLTNVFFPAWKWGPLGDVSHRFIGASHEESLAIRDSLKMRRLVTSDWYQTLWPEVRLVGDQKEKRNFENASTGWRQACPVKSMTGKRGDCLVGNTVVSTDRGEFTIRQIAEGMEECNVLSYDVASERAVYRPVQAVARCTSDDLFVVRSRSGREVTCTGDHRVYTARGYVPARLLSEGDEILLAPIRRLQTPSVPTDGADPLGQKEVRVLRVSQTTAPAEIEAGADTVAVVAPVPGAEMVYDLQVEGTRCFFADGVLVHNCVVWDDPHSVEDQYSRPALDVARRVFRETLPTRLNSPENSAIIVVMQRLSTDDVSGEILGGGYGYEHLCLPMEYEGPSKITSIGFQDPRTTDGELLFPQRFPRDVVDRDKKILGPYAAAGQFQQRPTPRGGGVFKDEWWQRYSTLPKLRYRKIFVDTAQKTLERHDYTVFECWGYDAAGDGYLIDLLRGKWEAPDLKNAAYDFWAKHKARASEGPLRAMCVEDKASGTGLIQELRRGDKAKGLPRLPITAIQRERDKYSRGMDVAPTIAAGRVWLPTDAPWLSDFLDEARAFPNGAHDDQLDPMMDAVEEVMNGGTSTTDRFKAMG